MEAGEVRTILVGVVARIWPGLSVRDKATELRGLVSTLRAWDIPDAGVLEEILDGPGRGEVPGGAGDGGLVEVRAGRDDEGTGPRARAA